MRFFFVVVYCITRIIWRIITLTRCSGYSGCSGVLMTLRSECSSLLTLIASWCGWSFDRHSPPYHWWLGNNNGKPILRKNLSLFLKLDDAIMRTDSIAGSWTWKIMTPNHAFLKVDSDSSWSFWWIEISRTLPYLHVKIEPRGCPARTLATNHGKIPKH